MFCPKCGSNQGEGRRFCTVCGTNLAAVSQALTGQIPQTSYYAGPVPHPPELERLEAQRQRDMAKGVRLSIIGGGIVALKFFSYIFSDMFRGGSPFGFWTFIGFVLLGIGISKIITSRPPGEVNSPAPAPNQNQTHSMQQANPLPVFSAPTSVGQSVPQTSELEPVGRYTPSATEDETRHLPHSKPPHELSR
jgi:F0F1-type ATP synthase assembly protein I